eukprot:5085174-Prymnesium_polylepis.1
MLSAAATDAMWAHKLGFAHNSTRESRALWNSLASLMEAHPTDFTILFRNLADVVEASAHISRLAALGQEARDELLTPLQIAFYEPLPEVMVRRWSDWLLEWLAALQEDASQSNRDAAMIAAAMRRTSPKFVPREWMLHEAYSAAEEGNHRPLQELHELLKRPYDEQPAAARRYFARAPVGSERQGGIGFMS